MDLTYSDEDEAFRAELRAWLAAEVPAHGSAPPPGDWEARPCAYDTAWQRKLYDAGYAGMHWPEEFGGRGLPVTQQLVYLEEYARADAPYIGVNFVGLMHAGPTVIAEGTDEQRAFHLRRILRGESVWCQGFSEPQAGSDLASLRTRAVRDGNEYVVNGQKIWSTRAHVADWCELLVRTDPEAPKHKGITWLILDMHQPGVEVRPLRTIDGESHFCEVFLTDARVPVTDRVGAENDGWRITNVTLRFERGTAFAEHIITLRSQLRELVSLAQRVPGPSGTAWDDPALREHVGRLEANVEGLWRLTQRAITEADELGLPSPSGSAVKLRYSEVNQELQELAIRVLGRLAIGGVRLDDSDVDGAEAVRAYLWSLQYTIAAGTSQIQRNLIAERILGMPRSRMSDAPRWTFGLEPLPQATEVAPLLRRVSGLILALDADDPAVAKLIDDLREAERALAEGVPAEPAPRLGVDASAEQRPYIDHSRDIGSYNPCFPEYEIAVDGPRATGTVTFPLAFEGPPGIVHGGLLATFFDCVVQHHNCDVGVAGKTTSLLLEYRRPTPLDVRLSFEIARTASERRITSRARLFLGDDTFCAATMEAVAGDRSRLPHVAPRVATS